MGFPDRSRHGRARLAVELLEDRTTPAKLDPAALALPELVATGAVVGDRVNVVMNAEVNNATDAAALAATPFASSVKGLGFGIYSVTLTPGTDLGTAVGYYNSFSGVLSAAPDEVVQLQQTPNDQYYSLLYGMTKIGAPTAWDSTTGGSNFVVGVIDSGVDYNHPDLAANIWSNTDEVAGNGVDDDANGFVDDIRGWDFANNDNNPMDDNGHGTHVAGTIGAVGNNSIGVAGVNWSVKIIPLKFLAANGSGSLSGAIGALNYAVVNGAKVSNNSWGGGGFSSALSTAISRARDAGHIFVAAAGNDGGNNDTTASYPGNYNFDNVVSVAATDSNDALASFSNYGASTVDLAAPGVSIASTTPNSNYAYMSGTSMAAPHVTGAIALYWNANPDLTYSEVLDKLKSSVTAVSGLSNKVATGGRLNVANMFSSTSPPTVAPGPKVTAATYSGTTATQFDKVRITFDKAIDATSFTAADIVSFTGPNGAITTTFGVAPVSGSNTQFDITFGAQTAAGSYSLMFGPDIRDTSGNQMNQNGNGTAGETADRVTVTASLVLNVNKTFSLSGLSLAIRDNSTTTSTLTISDNIKISDLNVRVGATHTYTGDLFITLTSPTVNGVAGKTVTLFNQRGGSGNNLTNTGFDDEASTAISSGAAPFNGTYRPDALLSAFDGLSTQGTWTLKVSDRATRDTGSLTAWSLVVNGTIGSATGSGVAKALGFLDEALPLFADEEIAEFEFDAEPLTVSVSEPARDSAPPIEIDYGPTFAFSSVSALSPEDEEREYATQSTEGQSCTDDEFLPVVEDELTEPLVASLTTLYFAPEASDSDDTGDIFAGDAE